MTRQLASTPCDEPRASSSSSRLLFQNLYNLRLLESRVSSPLATEKAWLRSARRSDELSTVGWSDIRELFATNVISLPRRRRLFLLGSSSQPEGVRDCIKGSRTADITRSNEWLDGVCARSARNGDISVSMGTGGGHRSPASGSQASTLSSSSRYMSAR